MEQKFKEVFLSHLNLCIFISLFVLSFHHETVVSTLSQYILDPWKNFIVIPAGNALLTAIIYLGLNKWLAHKHWTLQPFDKENKTAIFITGCIGGICSIYLALNEITTYLISALILYSTYHQVKRFIKKLSGLLSPDSKATVRDLAEFAVFFINLVIAFTVINVSLNTIHNSLNLPLAFNLGDGMNALFNGVYFSIITMTTVGYGDIYPQTTLARVIVGIECLTSYILLGIMIGIISRGVDFNKAQ